ncbi:hypothetical protein PSCICN_09280 [Pseudomonas cichorii]|nr:hypothetical protein PSCICN_09280 [Pseudomonas cichorii]
MTPYLLDLQHFGPDLRQSGFGFAQRRFIATTDQGLLVWSRKCLAVQLAVWCQWQFFKMDIGRRDHVLRQLALQMRSQDFQISCLACRGKVGNQTLIAWYVLPSHDHGFLDALMASQFCFDLAQFDTETANLHLIVVTAQVFDIAICQPTTQVASAVHAGASVEWILKEAFGRQVIAIQVATSYTRTADIDLARNTQRHRLAMFIQQVELSIRDGFADMGRETLFTIHSHPA